MSFWTIFCPFTPEQPRKSKSRKNETTPGDIIILHKCTINENHMMYGSWDMQRDRQFFLSFWITFCPFIPLTTPRIKILKKWKEMPGYIIILHNCNKNHDYMPYYSWDMVHDGCNFYFSFWSMFCSLPPRPNSLKYQNLKKKLKK